ncbi:MAG: sulfatase-like hydrolase/transferase, partial [Pseudomonadales bacterium]
MKPARFPNLLTRFCVALAMASLVATQLFAGEASQAEQTRPPNILVVLADDMGVETMASYGLGSPTADTPNLDRLATDGVRFESFWAQPMCSPTRSAILTGRQAFRTGVKMAVYWKWNQIPNRPAPKIPENAPLEVDFTVRGLSPKGLDRTMTSVPEGIDDPPGPRREEIMLPAVLKKLPTPYA